MQPAQGGRHCAHCQKVVVDFTRMTDAQLLKYFKDNGFGCGQFRNEQLWVNIKEIKVSNQNWLARIASSILFIAGLSKMAEAQTKKAGPQIIQKNNNNGATNSNKQLKEATITTPENFQVPIRDTERIISITKGQIHFERVPDTRVKNIPEVRGKYLLKTRTDIDSRSAEAYYPHRSFWRRLQFWRK